LAASLAAARAGVGHEATAAAVRTFRAVEHRLEFVRRLNGVEFYNDSKATSVDATLKALDAFDGGRGAADRRGGGEDRGADRGGRAGGGCEDDRGRGGARRSVGRSG